MAVSINSRYRQLGAYQATGADGAVHATLPIRRTPAVDTAGYRHRLGGVEDLEYLAWRYLRNSAAWWAVADRNPVRFPLDLRAGDILDIPVGELPDRTDRTRVFR
ncbi:hypothetical protein [Nocardia goodfellowii]|uniref:LysM domain-containing protein n=1 Tax=Nocardia goodfellowii TaxID=882446 RepID=A0ABS4QMN3_9NOCA|nr:hypothetical protein [Nocardia goodfellowii]MBP2192967.1 hypothetical protein [Nocardia goodfellowii]